MLEFLRDPIWQFIGAVFAFIAIIISIAIPLQQRSRKALTYRIIVNTSLIDVNELVKKKIEILYEGKKVEGVHFLLIKLENSGNVDIPISDYERPVSINFPTVKEILSASVDNTNSSTLQASISVEGCKIILSPSLINSGEWLTIRALLVGFDGTIDIDARIAGIKDIITSDVRTNYYRGRNILFGNIIIMTAGIGIFGGGGLSLIFAAGAFLWGLLQWVLLIMDTRRAESDQRERKTR